MSMDESAVTIGPDIWTNPVFADERFTRRLAYFWLLAHGPVKSSTRKLAKKWQWTASKVDRFIQNMAMAGLVKREKGLIHAIDLKDADRHVDRATGDGWTSIRRRVFSRDGFQCVYCGDDKNLHCDHVKPRAQGGLDTEDNLVTACRACNLSKSAKTPEEWRASE